MRAPVPIPAAEPLDRALRAELPALLRGSAEFVRLAGLISRDLGRCDLPGKGAVVEKWGEILALAARTERQIARLAHLVRRRSVRARLLAAQLRRAGQAEQLEKLSARSWTKLAEQVRRAVLLPTCSAAGDAHRRSPLARFSRIHRRRAP